MNIDGQVYYNKLIEDEVYKGRTLYGDYKNRMDLIRSGIVVCRNVPKLLKYTGKGFSADTGKTERKFTLFRSHLDLYNHMMKVPLTKRSFFEIIQGNKPHKPHFDIDIVTVPGEAMNTDSILSKILDAIIDTFARNNVVLDLNKDVLMYCSSRPEKDSYHIIINNWMHNDNKDAKNLAKQVRLECSTEVADYIDKSVYSAKQQFRLLHCTKLRTDSTKRPVLEWSTSKYHIKYPKIVNQYDEFAFSLVGVTMGCSMLPPFYDPSGSLIIDTDGTVIENVQPTNMEITGKVQLEKGHINKCLNALYTVTENVIGCAKNSHDIWNVFSVRSTEGGFISLTKKRPYYCPICCRKHENENPYMLVGLNGTVKYYCRRAETSLQITTLTGVTTSQEEEPEEEEDYIGLTPDLLKDISTYGSQAQHMTPNILKDIQFNGTKKPISIGGNETEAMDHFVLFKSYNRFA